MASALDTPTRRQLRKAFGGSVLDIIDAHEQGLRMHAETLRDHEERLERGRKNLGVAFENIGDVRAALKDFTQMGFWRRLRWLMRGK